MSALLELAARCEAATGPDRDIDGWIWSHLKAGERYLIGNKPGRFPQTPIYGERADVMRQIGGKDGADYVGAPHFTASLDAAMTLVPEDYKAGLGTKDSLGKAWAWVGPDAGENIAGMGSAINPALALTAAALRARASSEDRSLHGEGGRS